MSEYTDPLYQHAFEAGVSASQNGKPINPHQPGTDLNLAWHVGYMRASNESVRLMSKALQTVPRAPLNDEDRAAIARLCTKEPAADGDVMHALLEDALKVIDVQRAHLCGIDGMRASQDLTARGFADIRERILSALK